jgi:hypothetical protein
MSASKLDKLKQDLIMNIKAILGAYAKDGLTERELQREYIKNNGSEIQCLTLGFLTLGDFLQDLVQSKHIWCQRRGYLTVYRAVVTNEFEQNVVNLVCGQKDPKKTVRDQARFKDAMYKRYNQRIISKPDLNDKVQKKIVPNYLQDQIQTVLGDSTDGCLLKSQFVKNYYKRFGCFFEPQSFGYKNLFEMLSNLSHIVYLREVNDETYTICLKTQSSDQNDENGMSLESEVLHNLRKIITDANDKGGIWIRGILSSYKELTKKDLPLELLGYSNVLEFILDKLHKFVRIEDPMENGDLLLFLNDGKEKTKPARSKLKLPFKYLRLSIEDLSEPK